MSERFTLEIDLSAPHFRKKPMTDLAIALRDLARRAEECAFLDEPDPRATGGVISDPFGRVVGSYRIGRRS